MTTSLDHLLRMEYEKGYQDGLRDGIIAAHKNSDGRTPAVDSLAGKRLVAMGNEDGVLEYDAVHYEADYE